MAVSVEILKTAVIGLVSEAEKKLDERLGLGITAMKSYNGSISVVGDDINSDVLTMLIPRYKAAGWTEVKRGYNTNSICFVYDINYGELQSVNKQGEIGAPIQARLRKISL